MSAFSGEFTHKVDAKGRVSLPAEFRKTLGSNLKVTLDPTEKCIYVYEEDAFAAWIDSLFEAKGGYKPTDSRMIAQRRLLNARARSCEVDNSGRILLPLAQREKAGIEKEAIIVGNSDHFEIWEKGRWDEFCSEVDLASLFD